MTLGREHRYAVQVDWTGNRGTGTDSYRSYGRDHVVRTDGPAPIDGSADPGFRGDRERWNPEQLLLAAAAQCHMLSFLHLAAVNGVVVTSYTDDATGVMTTDASGGGRFTAIVLHPTVTVASADMVAKAESLHAPASEACFIAASLTVPVQHDVTTVVA